MKVTGKYGSVPQSSALEVLPKGWTVIAHLTLTSAVVKKRKNKSTTGKELLCRCCKSCELGKIHSIMITDSDEATSEQKPFSPRLWESSTKEKMAENISIYKQEKEEEVRNIRQLQKITVLENIHALSNERIC